MKLCRKKDNVKKRSNFLIHFILVAVLLLVITAILCLICAKGMNENVASVTGGVFGVFATVLLGLMSFYQNKQYRELAEEKSRQAEKLMFTPECRLVEVKRNIAVDMQNTIAIPNKLNKGININLVVSTINQPIIDFRVKSFCYYPEDNESQKTELPVFRANNNYNYLPFIKSDTQFYFNTLIPREYDRVSVICEATLAYKNIYDSKFEKIVKFKFFPRSSYGIVLPTDRATLIKENTEWNT